MIVTGLTRTQLDAIAGGLDLELGNVREFSAHRFSFRVVPHSSRARFARLAPSGRHLKATCYHGFQAFLERCFEAGLQSVRTCMGRERVTIRSLSEFTNSLDSFAEINVGSDWFPATMESLCWCWECGRCEGQFNRDYPDHTCHPLLAGVA